VSLNSRLILRDLNEFVSQVKAESSTGVDRLTSQLQQLPEQVPQQAIQFIQQTTQYIEASSTKTSMAIKKTTQEIYEKMIQEETPTVL
jgi:flagellar biosynthesis/type III secretory pathway protein FliH